MTDDKDRFISTREIVKSNQQAARMKAIKQSLCTVAYIALLALGFYLGMQYGAGIN